MINDFTELCKTLENGGMLSVLPSLDTRSVNVKSIFERQHPLLKFDKNDILQSIINLRPAETLAGTCDGNTVVSIVLSMLLFVHDPIAQSARNHSSNATLPMVCLSTDTIPFGENCDAIQASLRSFLQGKNITDCMIEFSLAAISSTISKVQLAQTCSDFLHECDVLLRNDELTDQQIDLFLNESSSILRKC